MIQKRLLKFVWRVIVPTALFGYFVYLDWHIAAIWGIFSVLNYIEILHYESLNNNNKTEGTQ